MSKSFWCWITRFCINVNFVLHFTNGSTLTPVTSPMEQTVYVTDRPTKFVFGIRKTECATECAFYAALNGGSSQCRCFNYDSNAPNCSLFNFEPQNYAVDHTGAIVAYEVKSKVRILPAINFGGENHMLNSCVWGGFVPGSRDSRQVTIDSWRWANKELTSNFSPYTNNKMKWNQ